eukprot:m.48696 g.48696  ORF g.48696 m.48696 type:complete len:51 (+) comp15950_c0_seq1:152-304(+)
MKGVRTFPDTDNDEDFPQNFVCHDVGKFGRAALPTASYERDAATFHFSII